MVKGDLRKLVSDEEKIISYVYKKDSENVDCPHFYCFAPVDVDKPEELDFLGCMKETLRRAIEQGFSNVDIQSCFGLKEKDLLPSSCFVAISGTNVLGTVKKGEKGIKETDMAETLNLKTFEETKNMAYKLNSYYGINKEMTDCMKAGAVKGWDNEEAQLKNDEFVDVDYGYSMVSNEIIINCNEVILQPVYEYPSVNNKDCFVVFDLDHYIVGDIEKEDVGNIYLYLSLYKVTDKKFPLATEKFNDFALIMNKTDIKEPLPKNGVYVCVDEIEGLSDFLYERGAINTEKQIKVEDKTYTLFILPEAVLSSINPLLYEEYASVYDDFRISKTADDFEDVEEDYEKTNNVLQYSVESLLKMAESNNVADRIIAAKNGVGLDKLIYDPDNEVRSASNLYLYDVNKKIFEWIKENPDKCVLKENKTDRPFIRTRN